MSERYDGSELYYDNPLLWLTAEIKEVKAKLDQVNKELSSLKFCWFGQKRLRKKTLKQKRADLKNRLSELYRLKCALVFGI